MIELWVFYWLYSRLLNISFVVRAHDKQEQLHEGGRVSWDISGEKFVVTKQFYNKFLNTNRKQVNHQQMQATPFDSKYLKMQ